MLRGLVTDQRRIIGGNAEPMTSASGATLRILSGLAVRGAFEGGIVAD